MMLSFRFYRKKKHLLRKYPNLDSDSAYLLRYLLKNASYLYDDYFEACERFNRADSAFRARKSRWCRYVEGMADTFGDLWLLTLTFADPSKMSSKTVRKYCSDWLADVTDDYFSCVEYGDTNGRVHCHSVVAFKASVPLVQRDCLSRKGRKIKRWVIDDDSLLWDKGFLFIRKIRKSEQDNMRSVRYCLKGTAYSVKSADPVNGVRPWHKRGVCHNGEGYRCLNSKNMVNLFDFEELPF